MLRVLASLALLVGAPAAPTAPLDSPHRNTSTVQIARAAVAPGNLWGVGSGPNLADIYQPAAPENVINPGLHSQLAALVAINPEWIRKLVTYTGDPATINEVTVNLYKMDSLEPIHPIVKKDFVAVIDRADAADGWWVGAVEFARLYELGYGSSRDAENMLDVLTGRRAKTYYTKINVRPTGVVSELIDKNRAWAIIKNAPREPLTLQTKPWDCVKKSLPCRYSWRIVGGHGGSKPGEPRWVTLHGRTGVRSTWDLDAIFPDIESIYGFANGAAEKP